MGQAAKYINDPAEFWIWLGALFRSVPNPKDRDPEFLFGISGETWDEYLGNAINARNGSAGRGELVLPQGKMLKRIVMSRAFNLMALDDRRTLIRLWAHTAITSAGKGTSPSEELIEFIGFVLVNCPEKLLDRAVKSVRELRH